MEISFSISTYKRTNRGKATADLFRYLSPQYNNCRNNSINSQRKIYMPLACKEENQRKTKPCPKISRPLLYMYFYLSIYISTSIYTAIPLFFFFFHPKEEVKNSNPHQQGRYPHTQKRGTQPEIELEIDR